MKIRKKYILIISLIAIIVAILGVSYALLQKDIIGSNRKIIYQVGDLEVKLDEAGSKDINLTNATPEEDSEGLSNEPYSFSLINNATTDLKYTIYLEDDTDAKSKCGTDCELVPYKFIRYNLSNDSESLKTDSLSSSSNELYTGTISSKATDKFNLRVWLSIDADNTAMNKYYFGKIKVVINQGDDYCIRNGFNTLSDCMLVMNNHESSVELAKQNITAKGTPDFSKTATTNEGLFMAEDDDGASYYYRGAVKNNYVSFAGFIWRIIRRNGDGSVRLIYAGKKTSDTGENTTIGNFVFNEKDWDPTYMGYMYSENFILRNNVETLFNGFYNTKKYNFSTSYILNESTKTFTLSGTINNLTWKTNFKEIVENEYYTCFDKINNCNILYKMVGSIDESLAIVTPISYTSSNYLDMLTNEKSSSVKIKLEEWFNWKLKNYNNYISNEIFCNDRNLISGDGYLITTGSQYGAYNRLNDNKAPILNCIQDSDNFSTLNKQAKLNYPIGLITADEVAMAGGVYNISNNKYYLYNNIGFYSMSPSVYDSTKSKIDIFTVGKEGNLYTWNSVSHEMGIRPVINLKSDVEISSGDGSSIAPFKVK